MKTLVNIFDPEEPLAAYLFLNQYYEEGDRLMFISTREDRRLLASAGADSLCWWRQPLCRHFGCRAIGVAGL